MHACGGLTQRFIWDPIHCQDEVIFEDDVSHDGEQVDKNERQYCSEDNGAAIACHALDHIQQGLFSID